MENLAGIVNFQARQLYQWPVLSGMVYDRLLTGSTIDRQLLADCTRTTSFPENCHWATGECANAGNVANSAYWRYRP